MFWIRTWTDADNIRRIPLHCAKLGQLLETMRNEARCSVERSVDTIGEYPFNQVRSR